MPHVRRSLRRAPAVLIAAAAVTLWASTTTASVIAVDWNVVPQQIVDPDGFPFYKCDSPGASEGVKCDYHWEEGIELISPEIRLYGDKWFDGFEAGAVPENDLTPEAGNAMRIQPSCKPAFAPCFGSFVPLQLTLDVALLDFPGNVFISSSAGDILKLPSLADDVYTIDFPNQMKQPVSWLRIGFYHPAACETPDPPEDLDCGTADRALIVQQFTFAVPEPGAVALFSLTAAICGARRLRRRAEDYP
jgi:hypothetical protein